MFRERPKHVEKGCEYNLRKLYKPKQNWNSCETLITPQMLCMKTKYLAVDIRYI